MNFFSVGFDEIVVHISALLLSCEMSDLFHQTIILTLIEIFSVFKLSLNLLFFVLYAELKHIVFPL